MARDAFEVAVVAYLIVHVAATLAIDGQALAPAGAYPAPLRDLLAAYVATLDDHLMRSPPLWFRAFIAAELALQLPFFVVGAAAWWARSEWVRVPSIWYGVHTATTLVPILADLLLTPGKSAAQYGLLAATYGPFAVMPLLIAWRASARAVLFPGGARGGKGKAA